MPLAVQVVQEVFIFFFTLDHTKLKILYLMKKPNLRKVMKHNVMGFNLTELQGLGSLGGP